jgi:hypothetical protein
VLPDTGSLGLDRGFLDDLRLMSASDGWTSDVEARERGLTCCRVAVVDAGVGQEISSRRGPWSESPACSTLVRDLPHLN